MEQFSKNCIKIFRKYFYSPMEKIYHIYAKDRCLFHSIKEEEFQATWSTLKNMVGVMRTDYKVEDLSFEELVSSKQVIRDSSH